MDINSNFRSPVSPPSAHANAVAGTLPRAAASGYGSADFVDVSTHPKSPATTLMSSLDSQLGAVNKFLSYAYKDSSLDANELTALRKLLGEQPGEADESKDGSDLPAANHCGRSSSASRPRWSPDSGSRQSSGSPQSSGSAPSSGSPSSGSAQPSGSAQTSGPAQSSGSPGPASAPQSPAGAQPSGTPQNAASPTSAAAPPGAAQANGKPEQPKQQLSRDEFLAQIDRLARNSKHGRGEKMMVEAAKKVADLGDEARQAYLAKAKEYYADGDIDEKKQHEGSKLKSFAEGLGAGASRSSAAKAKANARSSATPNAGSSTAPNAGANAPPQNAGSKAAPGASSNATPGAGSNAAPSGGSKAAPGTGSNTGPNAGANAPQNAGSKAAPSADSNGAPSAGSNAPSATGSSAAPGTGASAAPAGSSAAPNAGIDWNGMFDKLLASIYQNGSMDDNELTAFNTFLNAAAARSKGATPTSATGTGSQTSEDAQSDTQGAEGTMPRPNQIYMPLQYLNRLNEAGIVSPQVYLSALNLTKRNQAYTNDYINQLQSKLGDYTEES